MVPEETSGLGLLWLTGMKQTGVHLNLELL